ncbi:MAG: ABC transporter ATP-binding protein [Desulfuromonadales bacterium]|nr:ABC transporter ATP-binding protein [Desulfuromonadales bacterium]
MNRQIMIAVRALTKSFMTDRGKVEVLKEVDLDIRAGERIAVVGASGAGKTTLMHLLGGLDRPTSGTVHFAEKNIFHYSAQELDAFRNRSIGFVFQFHQLLPEFTALENVMMPALIGRSPAKEAEKKANEILTAVGLEHRLDHKPGQLSGGEQQRVAMARSLVMSPKLLLADEPTGNLDSTTSDEILALLDHLHAERDLTIVVVTHSDKIAGHMDRIVSMADGYLES